MIGVIVTGHGNFASGILSSVKLITGEQEKVMGVDFLEEDSTAVLTEKLRKAINDLGTEIIIFSDLAGGSPFKNAVGLKMEMTNKQIEVISGSNLPMILETVFMRNGISVPQLAETAISNGISGIAVFKLNEKVDIETNEEDGI